MTSNKTVPETRIQEICVPNHSLQAFFKESKLPANLAHQPVTSPIMHSYLENAQHRASHPWPQQFAKICLIRNSASGMFHYLKPILFIGSPSFRFIVFKITI
uniref:Uncharacterized protein n=1 Tax=Opuntia streptacantha TaxID=393608 RepID=A0A7C9CX13_OPUST